jgi:preprotein translocase subunit Sec61beta
LVGVEALEVVIEVSFVVGMIKVGKVETPKSVVGASLVVGMIKVGKVETPKLVVEVSLAVGMVKGKAEIPKVAVERTKLVVSIGMIEVGKAPSERVVKRTSSEEITHRVPLQVVPSWQQAPAHVKLAGPQGMLQVPWPFELKLHWETSGQHPPPVGHGTESLGQPEDSDIETMSLR